MAIFPNHTEPKYYLLSGFCNIRVELSNLFYKRVSSIDCGAETAPCEKRFLHDWINMEINHESVKPKSCEIKGV